MVKLTLMYKNNKVFDFYYDKNRHCIEKIEMIDEDVIKYIPIGIIDEYNNISIFEFNKWWCKREILAPRDCLKDVMFYNNLSSINNFTLLELEFYCLSLFDQYWVKNAYNHKNILWEDINYFDNDFSNDIGIPIGVNKINRLDYYNCEKNFKIIAGKRYFIKTGGKIYNQEPFNELIATKLYERILNNGEYVKYNLGFIDGNIVSICENFVTSDFEFIPASKLIGNFSDIRGNIYEYCITCFEKIGISDAREKINNMIVCDYILANENRNFENFGVLKNVETAEFIEFAPLFDNSCSLWFNEMDCYVGWDSINKPKPFKEYDRAQVRLVKDFSFLDINKLEGFSDEVREILSRNELLTEVRINNIISSIDDRINYIKSIVLEEKSVINVCDVKKNLLSYRQGVKLCSLYDITQIDFSYCSNIMRKGPLSVKNIRDIYDTDFINAAGVNTIYLNTIIETRNHLTLFKYMLDTIDDKLTDMLIKDFHFILKNGTYNDFKEEWKDIVNYKSMSKRFENVETTPAESVFDEIVKLLEWYDSIKNKTLEDIMEFYIRFQKIHPFADGNFRVGMMIVFRECLINNLIPFYITADYAYLFECAQRKYLHDNIKDDLIGICRHCQIEYENIIRGYM